MAMVIIWGFTLGLFLAHKYALIIPLCLLPTTVTGLNANQFLVQTLWLTIVIGVTTEFVAVYSFSSVGAWLRKN